MSEARPDSPTLRLRRLDAATHELTELVRATGAHSATIEWRPSCEAISTPRSTATHAITFECVK